MIGHRGAEGTEFETFALVGQLRAVMIGHRGAEGAEFETLAL
jgi:hypothetical protein